MSKALRVASPRDGVLPQNHSLGKARKLQTIVAAPDPMLRVMISRDLAGKQLQSTCEQLQAMQEQKARLNEEVAAARRALTVSRFSDSS